MEGISDIKIVGIDEKRPPQMRKEPYINLYFVLSHQAPAAWCEDFNRLASKYQYSAKIDEKQGRYIETWVRKMEEIEPLLARLKETVQQCSIEYIARIEAATASVSTSKSGESVEQVRLNTVISGLKFD